MADPNDPMTVSSLLKQLGKPRSGKCAAGPGKQCDHVVELQVVVNALNRLNFMYTDKSLRKLVDFFGGKGNLESIKAEENQKKGKAIRRFLAGKKPKNGDQKYITRVREKWQMMENELTGDFVKFKAAMNEALGLED